MLALPCNRVDRTPVNEVHARYCCGKRVLLARAQGNERRMAITALGEETLEEYVICKLQLNHMAQQSWRDRSMLVKIIPHIHSGYQILLSFMLLETSKLTLGFILNLHFWE